MLYLARTTLKGAPDVEIVFAILQDPEEVLSPAEAAESHSPSRRTSMQRNRDRLEERISFVSGHGLTVPANNAPSSTSSDPPGDFGQGTVNKLKGN